MCEQCPTPLVTGHPFKASAWPDTCGQQLDDGWFCGLAEEEHAARPTPADGAEPDRAAEYERTKREGVAPNGIL